MSGYTRSFSGPSAGRDSTIPRFHMEAVEDPIATAAQGRPIYREEERVQIIQPGNPNSPVVRVDASHLQRWPEQYAAFKQGQDYTANGTPLEQWPFLKKMNVLELKAKNIHTVEQCAGLSDRDVQSLGMGGLTIRENAKAYLDDAAATAIVSQALADKERLEGMVSNLQSQLDELRPLLDRLHNENMALRDAPSAVQTYRPGDHDPVQRLSEGAPAPENTGSSLDNLMARRPRGRPPGVRTEAA